MPNVKEQVLGQSLYSVSSSDSFFHQDELYSDQCFVVFGLCSPSLEIASLPSEFSSDIRRTAFFFCIAVKILHVLFSKVIFSSSSGLVTSVVRCPSPAPVLSGLCSLLPSPASNSQVVNWQLPVRWQLVGSFPMHYILTLLKKHCSTYIYIYCQMCIQCTWESHWTRTFLGICLHLLTGGKDGRQYFLFSRKVWCVSVTVEKAFIERRALVVPLGTRLFHHL